MNSDLLFIIALSSILVAVALSYGYRTTTAALVSRSLSSVPADNPSRVVDGEPMAVEGTLVVDDAVEMGGSVADGIDSPVGVYVWRARFPDNTNHKLTADNGGWKNQHYHTFASGIEWGRFGVVAGDRTIWVDPEQLRKAYDSDPLRALTVGGINRSNRLSVYLWDSWYLFLRNQTLHLSLGRFEDDVERHNDGVDLDRYLLEAKPLLEGETVSVRGKGHVEGGEQVLRGAEDTPLIVSDQGFDSHRRWLRLRIATKGAIAASVLLAAVGVWFEIWIPLLTVIAANMLYVLYRFVMDLRLLLRR